MVRRAWWFAAVMIGCGMVGGPHAGANPHCGPSFAYGNAGYGAGYSSAGFRRPVCGSGYWSGGSVCGPWWRGGCRVGGWPVWGGGGYSFGWPGFGFGGCYGAGFWQGCESVSLAVPPGGGATFFCGRAVPFVTGWPTIWYPPAVGAWGWYPTAVPAPVGAGPRFGPAGILPFLGASTRGTRAVNPTGAAPRPTVRIVNGAERRRAARFVATGDRHLREARAGVPARARAALDAYRRAAAAAPDDPDLRVREALALVALGDATGADGALARAIAIDGRLAAAPPRRGDQPPDPVFGDRNPGEPAPLAARGAALLREIGGEEAAAVEWIAARWGDRWGGNAAAVASR